MANKQDDPEGTNATPDEAARASVLEPLEACSRKECGIHFRIPWVVGRAHISLIVIYCTSDYSVFNASS